MMNIRPRRSVLYMPGSNPRALEKARTLAADCYIFDLEDAVAPETKTIARKNVSDALQSGGYGNREIIIRINALETPWGEEDLTSAIKANPNAILLPKVNTCEDIFNISRILDEHGANPQMQIWAMMETSRAVLDPLLIARACENLQGQRLRCLVMGTNDLAKETRVQITPSRLPMLGWLANCVAAARVYGLDVIDGVFNDFKDLNGLSAECVQARELGMDGKTLIHPSQIEPCNSALSPTPDEIAWARTVISEFDKAEHVAKGAIQIKGKMVERMHAEMAQRVVAIADAIAGL